MSIHSWKILSSKYVYRDNWFVARTDECELPNGKIINPYYVVEVPNWCNVIIATSNEELVMVQQYRHAANIVTIEPAGGLIDANETPLKAAIREMHEETGYTSNDIELIMQTKANPALQPTTAYFYLAKNAIKTENEKFDEYEDLSTIILPKEKVLKMLQNDEFHHGVQVGAIYKACIKLGWI